MKFSQYTNKNIEEVFSVLKTSENGLSEEEATNRRATYGLNEIKERELDFLAIFLRQFKSPFFYLLFFATTIAFLIGEIINGFLILGFVLINVFLGFFQEYRAERTAVLLKNFTPLKTRVLRGGREKTIDKNFLVPGDIVFVEPGNIVPADLKALRTENLLVDESILSGESVPVSKTSQALTKKNEEIFGSKNIIFAGSSIISGEGQGLVIGTGRETVLGEIAKLVSGTIRQSVYEKNLLKFSRIILRTVVVSITFVFLANIAIKGTTNLPDFIIFCIALIVSIIPEALPVVVTFSLSRGALRLAKEKVIVKRLSAIEDLGNIEILCSDKTGTLTENKLQLDKIHSLRKEDCLLYGLLSSSYLKEEIESSISPFDSALFEKASGRIRRNLKNFKVISETSFDSERLRNNSLLEDRNGNLTLIVKGAPEVVLKLCSEFEGGQNPELAQREMEKEGQQGKRVLAVSFKRMSKRNLSFEDEKDMTFLGFFSFVDPLKKTTKEAVRLAEKLGVQIKILTGDSKETAAWVAKETGLIKDIKKVISGEELNSLSQEEFNERCREFSVFARVSPQTKYKIVETLQKKYEIGFLGEGVNDAPALKVSNVAIAVEGAADISREASDIILLKKDLKVIVEGVKNGRNVFSNINKYIKCTLSSNFGNFYSIAVISLMIPFLPMLPIQILLVNLLSDFPLIAVTSDKIDAEELKKPKLYQLNKMTPLIIMLALVSTVFDFIFFSIFHKAEPSLLQTLWFIESILTEIVLIFSVRTFRFFLGAKIPSLSLIILSLLTIIITISLPFSRLGQELFRFTAPSLTGLLIVLSLVAIYFAISETVKLLYFRYWVVLGRKNLSS